MTQPPKPFTVADIHAVYANPSATKRVEGDHETPTYSRSPHFKRDPEHAGKQPLLPTLTRGPRRK